MDKNYDFILIILNNFVFKNVFFLFVYWNFNYIFFFFIIIFMFSNFLIYIKLILFKNTIFLLKNYFKIYIAIIEYNIICKILYLISGNLNYKIIIKFFYFVLFYVFKNIIFNDKIIFFFCKLKKYSFCMYKFFLNKNYENV